MTENPLHRIKKYIDFKGITVSAFEKSLDFSNGSFASQLKNNKSIGSDKLEYILKHYNDLNANWVFTGYGKMINETDTKFLKNDLSIDNIEVLKMIIESQKETIESQKTTINCCKIAIEILFDKNNPDKVNFESEMKQTYIDNILENAQKSMRNK